MFIACTRSSPPIVVHGVVEDGKIQEILPSGKKGDIICNRQEFRPSISDRIIRSITMRPSLEVPLIVKDPNSDKREILSINVRDLNRVTERISRQRESLIIRGLFQEDSTREGLGFVELDEIHKICLSEELQAFDEIKVGNGRIIKYRDKWHKVRHEADGGSLKVAVCDQFAVKILKEGMFVPEHLKSAKDVDDLLRRINKDNNATGVEKRPVSPMRNRQFATYDISGSGEVIKQLYSRAVQVEVPFASDCKNALRKNWIQKEEVCSLAACLVEGSKTLIEARVYPLDVKLANIGYLGRGKAAHIDLRGFWNPNTPPAQMDVIISVRYVSKERKIMMRASSVDAKERIAHKIHIFLLGECLIQIATGKSFYHSNETGEKFLFNKPTQETIDFMQAHDSCYSESQKAMIQKMMAKNIEKRPFIQEVALEFPLSLKGNIGSLSKHPWE